MPAKQNHTHFINTSIKPTPAFPKSEFKRTLMSKKGRQKNMLWKPTTNKSATSIKQDSYALKHTHDRPTPHPPPAPLETNETTPSSTCSVLSLKVPPESFILHVSSKLPAHYSILRGRMAAGRKPDGSLAHGPDFCQDAFPSHLNLHPKFFWSGWPLTLKASLRYSCSLN